MLRTALPTQLAELAAAYELTIIDTPAVLAQPDAALLAGRVDAVVLVVEATRSRVGAASRAADLLRAAGAPGMVAVLNGVPTHAYQRYDREVDRPPVPSAAAETGLTRAAPFAAPLPGEHSS